MIPRLGPHGLQRYVDLLFTVGKKYPSGRDTVHSWGDGRFQVHRLDSPDRLILGDLEKDAVALESVDRWLQVGEWVYVAGRNNSLVWRNGEQLIFAKSTDRPYVVFNYRTGVRQAFTRLKDIPSPYQAMAQKL